MALALGLAGRGLGNVWPNPAVGCVIVQGSTIVGRGFTQPGGRPHAERAALDQAGTQARGATAYVTLEPCAHHGQTPPCAAALIAAGVARVVSAATDPDPRVGGRGHAMLRAAGLDVIEGVLEPEARALNAGYLSRVLQGRPRVTLKLALSLDGRIANAAGASRWVTGPQARRAVHMLRAHHDAVMVGIGTVLADDPDLTVRELGISRQPIRIVVDSQLRLPPKSRLMRSAAQTPVWLCHAGPARPLPGPRLISCASDGAGRVDLRDALHQLGSAGLTRVFCEGGSTLAAALLNAVAIDELICISAGRVFGAAGTPAVAALPAPRDLTPQSEFVLVETRPLGEDVLHRWLRR